jgi:signal transduction histidine kinase
MTKQTRDWIAGGVAALGLTISLIVLVLGTYEPGLRLAVSGDGLVVAQVLPFSLAAREGIDPNQPNATPPPPILVGPSRPKAVATSAGDLVQLSTSRIDRLDLARPDELTNWSPESSCCARSFYANSLALSNASLALLPGLALLLLGVWFLDSGRGGESLRPIAVPAAAAAATPFLVQPMRATEVPDLAILAGLLTVAAMIPLALGLAERVEDSRDRPRLVLVGIAALAVFGAISAVLLVTAAAGTTEEIQLFRWASIGAIPLVPGIAAAGPLNLSGPRAAGSSSRRLMQSTELALAGATPLFALATDRPPFLWPIALWLGAIAIAGRFTVRPLARLATRAQLQRDLVVAATEAERARVAADIHDEALQELTLLVRRLETSGDTEGAEMGRTIADRLRAICGDLRLPILDDLGVGPALDWLVLRIERLAGGEVRLERADDARHSPDVELAIFRVAQEALANAVKHGKPPIVVRYRSTPGGISLAIDDAGPGIADDAPATAERAGRFGLLNMGQRAEQIGAILDVKRWPAGGTHVALEWRPR